jgi:integrase
MRGNIEQRGDGRWRLRVFVGRENGRTKLATRSFRGTKRQAETELAKFVADVERNQVAVRHSGSLQDLLIRWLDAIDPDRSRYTMKEYRRLVERNIGPAPIGSERLAKLTGARLDAFYAALREQGLSSESVRRHHALLHTALGRAVKWGLIPNNPADRATPPGLTGAPISAPSTTAVQQLIEAAEKSDPVLATAIALGAITGARRGELCALRWSDVDWQRRTLRVQRSLTVIGGEPIPGPTKTHSQRFVSIDGALEAFLRKRLADQENYAELVGVQLVSDPYVLSRSADGSDPCLPNGLTGAYRRVSRRIGLPGHFHELRHFTATTAIGSGTDVRTVSGRLGHADPSVTLKVYTHFIEERDRDLARLLGTAALGPMKETPKPNPADHPAPPELESAGQLTSVKSQRMVYEVAVLAST